MKKLLLVCTTAALGAFILVHPAKAQETSVQFYCYDPIPSGTSAGIDGATNWNGLSFTGGAYLPFGQEPSASSASNTYNGITFNISADGYYNQAFGNFGSDATLGDNKLISDGVGTTGLATTAPASGSPYAPAPVMLTISGLETGASYDLTVYIGGQGYNPGAASLSLTDGGTQYFMTSKAGNNDWPDAATTWIDGATTTDFITGAGQSLSGLSGYRSNYLTFNDFTASSSSETLILTELGAFDNPGQDSFTSAANGGLLPIGINGVQIRTVSVPEPGTIWSAWLGLMGLICFQANRRSVSWQRRR